MRKLFFVRHGQTAQEYTDRCISQTDILLDAVGREQAGALAEWLISHPVTAVYSSPLQRCRQSAEIMAPHRPVLQKSGLSEIRVGEWENLSFSEIKKRWPDEYTARGEHMGTVAPPKGESFAEGAERMENVLKEILSETRGDLLVVTHAGILRGWLCRITDRSPDAVFDFTVPYGSITEVWYEDDVFTLKQTGAKPVQVPGTEEIRWLYDRWKTPENVIEHCQAVAKKARELAEGFSVDEKLLQAAALLHDLCRTEGKDHPRKAAKVLRKAGYARLADIVSVHSDLCGDIQADILPEAQILYLADKLFVGTVPVSLKERFDRSGEKCKDDAALAAWSRRFASACELSEKYMR